MLREYTPLNRTLLNGYITFVLVVLAAQHGHQILWLPPYSPDLNPFKNVGMGESKRKNGWLTQ